MVTGLRSVRDRLPFDPALGAFNVGEISISQEVIREATAFYDRHIVPHLGSREASVSVEGRRFYAMRPAGWPSDIQWWSADDEVTFSTFQQLFDQIQPALAARGFCPDGRLYCGFFVTRSYCSQTALHVDFVDQCGANAYTLMTPLDDWEKPVGQLVYRDALGRLRTYQYKKGSAVVLGAGFHHGTQPCAEVPRAFLCFTFGTSDPGAWRHIRKTVLEQGRFLRQYDGTFVDQTHRGDFTY